MSRTFNCGIGVVLIVNSEDGQHVLDALKTADEKAWIIGKVPYVERSLKQNVHNLIGHQSFFFNSNFIFGRLQINGNPWNFIYK